MSKSEFIRSLPDKSAAEVVSLAKAKGLTMTTSYVYSVRAHAKSKNGAPISKDQKLKQLVLQLGTTNIRAAIDKIEQEILAS